MLLNNITFSIEPQTEKSFCHFLKKELSDFLNQIGIIQEIKIYKLLTEIDNGAETIALQLDFASIEQYIQFETEFKAATFDKINEKFSAKYLMFSTLLERV